MSAEQLNEQEIQFKKRARRRLVGAIALVLLMVTVLPMLLDDRSSKVPQQEIAITIPSQENSDFSSKVAPVAPESQPQPPSGSDTDPAVPSASQGTTSSGAADSQPTSVAQPPKEAPAEAAPDKPATEKPAARPVAETAAYAVQIGVFSNTDSIKPLQQKLRAQGYKSYTEKIATDKGEKIRLRAGPFTSRAEAEQAMARIKNAGMAGLVVTK